MVYYDDVRCSVMLPHLPIIYLLDWSGLYTTRTSTCVTLFLQYYSKSKNDKLNSVFYFFIRGKIK
jgi:hypothetical protein